MVGGVIVEVERGSRPSLGGGGGEGGAKVVGRVGFDLTRLKPKLL